MKRIFITFVITVIFCSGSILCWTNEQQAEGANDDNYSDHPSSVADDGTIFKWKEGSDLAVGYLDDYTWDGNDINLQGLGATHGTIVSPDKTYGFTMKSGTVYRVSSTDGISFTIGEEISAFYDTGNPPHHISYAWDVGQLVVTYYDGSVKSDFEPLNNPQSIYLDGCGGAAINYNGTVIVTSDACDGNYNLFEWWGNGFSWSGKTRIDEICTDDDERRPTFGELEGDESLFFSRWVTGEGYNIWYSIRAPSHIQPTSLGVIKSLFE